MSFLGDLKLVLGLLYFGTEIVKRNPGLSLYLRHHRRITRSYVSRMFVVRELKDTLLCEGVGHIRWKGR